MVQLANYWANNGKTVYLITFDPIHSSNTYKLDDKIVHKEISFSKSGFSIIRKFNLIRRVLVLRKELKLIKPNVILSFMTPTNVISIIASLRLKIRCIISERVNPAYYSYGTIINILRKIFYRYSDTVVIQTKSIEKWIVENTGSKTYLIPNFILNQEKLPNESKKDIVLAIGRLDMQKGFDVLIKSFSIVVQKFPNWKLEILGDGNERSNLQNLISHYKLDLNVKLLGFQKDVLPYFYSSSIYVHPSRFEGFPNSLLEAMSFGLPSISTKNSADSIIQNEINGLLIDSENIEMLAFSIIKLIQDNNLRKNISMNSLGVNQDFGFNKIILQWERLLFI